MQQKKTKPKKQQKRFFSFLDDLKGEDVEVIMHSGMKFEGKILDVSDFELKFKPKDKEEVWYIHKSHIAILKLKF